MKKVLTTSVLSWITIFAIAQSKDNNVFPEVGKPCPDFTIRNVAYYPTSVVRPSDFRKKWLVLDFFDKNCTICIASFPRYNDNQKRFADQVQFLLVGREDRENSIRAIYDKYRKQEKLVFPCAFDSSIFRRLDINSSPFTVIVNPDGIVQYVTTYFSSKDLEAILAGQKPVLKKAYREHEPRAEKYTYDRSLPLLVNNNGGSDTSFLFRSLLSSFNPDYQVPTGLGPITYPIDKASKYRYRFEAIGIDLHSLYRTAYLGTAIGIMFRDSLYGKVWKKNILEVRDSSLFFPDFTTGKNYFCYSLSVPPSKYNRNFLMTAMQRDLKNYFGYEVAFEKRKMPYWRLVATADARSRLPSKGGMPYASPTDNKYRDSFAIKNKPIAYLIEKVLPTNTTDEPFIDETGINGNIDITLHLGMLPKLSRIIESLRTQGLDLVIGEREMWVLVIKEATQP